MRILIVSQYFWPENFRINDLVEGLVDRGHEVTVLTGVPNYPEGSVFPEFRENPARFASFRGVPVLRVPMFARGRGKLRLALNYLSFAAGGMAVGPVRLGKRPFDAIFVFQTSPITAALPALRIARRSKAPVLMWVLDLWPDTLEAIGVVRSPRLLAAVGALVRFIYRRSAKILIQSRGFAEGVMVRGARPAQVEYFPGWAESVFAEASEAAPASEMRPFAKGFTMLFAGNIGEAQDFPALIEAMARLGDKSNTRIVVVGGGRALEAARAEVARRGLLNRIVFLGRFPLERMPSFFAAADALLVSLVDEPIWSMTIPGKVQSYLAAGRPILAMLNGEGARVIEESGAGYASPAGDPAALAENILRLSALPQEDRLAMGSAGMAYGKKHFDREMLIDQLEGWMFDAKTAHG